MSKDLPITPAKRAILHAIDHHDITIVVAETGSGKTTQLPKYLIEAGYCTNNKNVAISVPRRIAAISIAKRASEELLCNNNEIAHHVRFNSSVTESSRVIFMTDGMLVQELYFDCMLEKYSVIVLDDVHEKSVNLEILFGFLKKIQMKRRDLKVVITSATIETKKIQAFFLSKLSHRSQQTLKIKTIQIPGRIHKVKIHYLQQNTKNYFLKTFQTLIYLDRQTSSGTILVFLTSIQQIQAMAFMLNSYSSQNRRKMTIIELHSKMSLEKQNEIFDYQRTRKIILSTNIAESSITIPDVQYVVDCGFVKVKVYDNQKGVEKMMVVECGKSSAIQRAGRAGRVTDGQCYRIYTENGYNRMDEIILPEIMRIDLTSFILKLMGLGIKDILNFQMIDKPSQQHFSKAIDILYAYQLVNENFELTLKGQHCAQLSLDIRTATMLMNSFEPRFGCSKQILMLVSMLQVQQELFTNNSLALLKAKKRIGCKQGDFLTLINIFIRYSRSKLAQRKKVCSQLKVRQGTMEQALKIHDNLLSTIKKFKYFRNQYQEMANKYTNSQDTNQPTNFQLKSSSDQYQAILRCILSGYFTNIAQAQSDGTYFNINSKQKLQIHPTSLISVTYPKWIVYHQIIKTNTGYFVHNASKIQSEWIFELVGHYYQDIRAKQHESRYKRQQEKQELGEVKKLREENYERRVKEGDGQIQGGNKLVQVGGKKVKPELFNTKVLGLKNMKKNKLSFQEDFDI